MRNGAYFYVSAAATALAALGILWRILRVSLKRGRMLEVLYTTLMGTPPVFDNSGAEMRHGIPGLPALVAENTKTLLEHSQAIQTLQTWIVEHTDLHTLAVGTFHPQERRTQRKTTQVTRDRRHEPKDC